MTKEQAIKFANCLKNNYTIDFNDMADFCDMVIKALEQETVSKEIYCNEHFARKQAEYELWKIKEQQPSEDCVSRADLLKLYEDRFIELQKAHHTDKQLGINWCINTLKEMPPVTPTHGTCKDCGRLATDKDGDKYCELSGRYNLLNFYCADFEVRGDSDDSN